MLPWLQRITLALAADVTRRRSRHGKALQVLWHACSLTTGQPQAIPSPIVASEVMALLGGLIRELPGRQRLVMQAYVEHYPDSANMDFLR